MDFKEYEKRGREVYEEYEDHLLSGATGYTFTEDEYCKYDVVYDDDRVDEIKYRDIPASRYINGGYIYEKIKYDEHKQHNRAYYVNFFQEENNTITILWDVKKDHKWYERECAKSMAEYNTKKNKIVTYLKFEDAEMVLFNNRLLNNDEKNRCEKWLKERWVNKTLLKN